MIKHIKKISAVLAFSAAIALPATAQVSIDGPTCVISGTVYQYTITGNWDSLSTMQVCVTGGTIADSAGTNQCNQEGAPLAKVLIIWNDSSASDGAVSITSPAGNAQLSVHFTEPLLPGYIDSAVKVQYVGLGSIPVNITCSPDSGGSCSPVYQYQWQMSPDMVNWTDIPDATGASLSFDTAISIATYYRKKIIETSSGSIGYSDVAAVFLGASSMIFPIRTSDCTLISAHAVTGMYNRNLNLYNNLRNANL